MAQWGRNDQSVTANSTTTVESSNGAPIGTYALVKAGGGNTSVRVDAANAHYGNTSAGSRANVDVGMFENTTISAYIPGVAVGVYGVDTTEMGLTTGSSNGLYRVTSGGTGYGANAVVTLTFANGVSNVSAANSTVGTTGTNAGRVTAFTSNVSITGITGANPTLTVAAPGAINITANSTGFSNTTDTIVVATANSKWQVGDRLYYAVPAGNTAIAPLTGNTYYYVSFANTTTIALSATAGGANVNITDARTTASGETHTIQGDTATGVLIVTGAKRQGAAHAGWVLRTEGTGGRAGRVQMETLVAMGSLGAQTAAYGTAALVPDGSDDNVLHDS
jgi:hypothetical protein